MTCFFNSLQFISCSIKSVFISLTFPFLPFPPYHVLYLLKAVFYLLSVMLCIQVVLSVVLAAYDRELGCCSV